MPEELFNSNDQHFSFTVSSTTLTCDRLSIPGYIAFRVSFSSQREPIVIARGYGKEQAVFWTSIPEGRQKEAEGVGKLIEEHLREKK